MANRRWRDINESSSQCFRSNYAGIIVLNSRLPYARHKVQAGLKKLYVDFPAARLKACGKLEGRALSLREVRGGN